MVGALGPEAVAGLGFANQLGFLFTLLLFATSSTASVFYARFLSSGELESNKLIESFALIVTLILATGFFLIARFFSQTFLSFYSNDLEAIAYGRDYLSILAFSYPLYALSFHYTTVLRTSHKTVLPMIVGSLSLLLNTFGNWLLIFGKLGAPALGVRGAGLASLLARFLECIILLAVVFRGSTRQVLGGLGLRRPLGSSKLLALFARTGLPVLANESLWSLAVTAYQAIYGRVGTLQAAAAQIVVSMEQLVLMAFFGISSGAAILIGNSIGAGKIDQAQAHGIQVIRFAVVGAMLGSLVLAIVGLWVLPAFGQPETVLGFAKQILLVLSIFLCMKIGNALMIAGVFRAGGDTKFCLFLEGGLLWGFGIPLTALVGLVLKLDVWAICLSISLEELLKFGFAWKRLVSGKWIKALDTPLRT